MTLLQVFSHFSPKQKNARLAPHSGSELSADFTPSTPPAQQQSTSPAMERDTWVDGDDVWVLFDTLQGRTGDSYCPTTGNGTRVVRALTAVGWSLWWSPGLLRSHMVCGCFSAAAWETELGPSSRQSTEAFSNTSSFPVAACVVRTWNLYSISFTLLREILVCYSTRPQRLGSTVDTCSAPVAALLDEWHLFSTAKWTRILKWFFSVLLQNGEVSSVDASVFTPFAQLALRRVMMPVVSGLPIHLDDLWTHTCCLRARVQNNNKTTTIIQSGEAPFSQASPLHSGELNHALSQAGGPTQSQLSRPVSSGHHISMEHRLRKKQLNSDTNASNETYLKEIQEKKEKKKLFS